MRRSKWRNSPHSLRRRSADADARRETLAALLPPVYAGPEPLSPWQTVQVLDGAGRVQHTLRLYVPTAGRCDQHAAEIDGARADRMLTATDVGRLVASWIDKRPSRDQLADWRRDETAMLTLDAPGQRG
jgi:hypothetical protein